VRSDVYAFSATLYHLLANAPPVEARERFLQPGRLSPLRALNPEISPRTERAIFWGMSLHPDERPQSMDDIRKALLGTWSPMAGPRAVLPSPSLADVVASPVERTLVVVSAALIFLSLVATLVH